VRLNYLRRNSPSFRNRQFSAVCKKSCAKPARRNRRHKKMLVYDFHHSNNHPHNMALLLTSRKPANSVSSLAICYRCQQIRNATLLRRPKRPYTFTQLITLTDGSSYLHRTTSPAPVYRATKDIRNSPLWNPSSQKLLNIEEDEAGKLRRFRAKFGRGWDAATVEVNPISSLQL